MTAAQAPGSERDNPGVRIPPPFFFVVPLLAGLWLERLMPVGLVPASWEPTLTIVGASLAAAALLFGAWAIVTFVRARTHVIPVRPATTLVTWGPFRFSRNPMYVQFVVLYVGASLWAGALWPFLFLPLVLLAVRRLVIAREEAYLERRFGDEYRAYCAATPRWL